MPVTRLNHAVLYVRDVAATKAFYEGVLDFQPVIWMPDRGVFHRAPASTSDHDLAAFQISGDAGPSTARPATVGLYHLAWEVDTLAELARAWPVCSPSTGRWSAPATHSTTKSLYAHDPDGLELVCWIVLPTCSPTRSSSAPAAG